MMSRMRGATGEQRHWRESSGFTLIELMIALVILAILVTLSVPSFNNAALSSKLSSISNDLVASAQLARSEAIKRNAPITLCASSDGTSCATSGGWQVGWILLNGTTVLQRRPALPPEFRVAQAGTFGAVTFPPDVIGVTAATFTVCRADPVGNQERVVRISVSGGTSVVRTENAACP